MTDRSAGRRPPAVLVEWSAEHPSTGTRSLAGRVRILGGPSSSVVGAGIQLTGDLVLTCWHVVDDGTGADQPRMLVDTPSHPGTRVAAEVTWSRGVGPAGDGDLAVLRCATPLPSAPATLADRGDDEFDVRIVGFPANTPASVMVLARAVGPVDAGTGWRQPRPDLPCHGRNRQRVQWFRGVRAGRRRGGHGAGPRERRPAVGRLDVAGGAVACPAADRPVATCPAAVRPVGGRRPGDAPAGIRATLIRAKDGAGSTAGGNPGTPAPRQPSIGHSVAAIAHQSDGEPIRAIGSRHVRPDSDGLRVRGWDRGSLSRPAVDGGAGEQATAGLP